MGNRNAITRETTALENSSPVPSHFFPSASLLLCCCFPLFFSFPFCHPKVRAHRLGEVMPHKISGSSNRKDPSA